MIQIELKSVKVTQALSEETYNYSAKLYADGRYIADIGNDGHGGADRLLKLAPGVNRTDYEKIGARVSAEHPKEDLFGDGNLSDPSLEGVCHDLVSEHLITKDVTRLLKSKVAFFEDGLPAEGETAPLYVVKVDAKKGHTVTAVVAHLKRRHPKAFFLNDIAIADAVSAYKRTA